MELLVCIHESLIEQNRTNGRTLYSSTNRNYITVSLHWVRTIEGYLFWEILHNSYLRYGTYDYITIFKLYNLYGAEVFKLVIYPDYNDYDSETNTLTSEGFEKLCSQIERHGIIRKHSREFN